MNKWTFLFSFFVFSQASYAQTDLERYHECLDRQDEYLKYCNDSSCVRKYHHRFNCILKKGPRPRPHHLR